MLRNEIERQGNAIFRKRSWLPLVLIPIAAFALWPKCEGWCETGSCSARVYDWICFAVSILGMGFRGMAVGYAAPGTSGRNRATQIADTLNQTGPYSIVRHPLYVGNIVMTMGIVMLLRSPLAAICALLIYLLLYERIIAAEEGFLNEKYGKVYEEWAARTPYIIPCFRKWIKSDRAFSWKYAVRSEVYSFASIAISFFLLITIRERVLAGEWSVDKLWMWISIGAVLLYFPIRFLRKHTRVLEEKV